jgi:purine-cytosine permease-like protein
MLLQGEARINKILCMIKNSTLLTILLGLSFFVACGQHLKTNPADKFLEFLNNYQIDSLRVLIADNFQLKRTYSTYANNPSAV